MNPLRCADMFIGISVGMLDVVSSVESRVVALVASDRLFGRESDRGSEVVGSSKERTTATWIRGVVNSLAESRQRFLSTNPTEADTLRLLSILNIDL